MSTTIKRVHVALTKEQLRQIEELKSKFGENTSDILKRGLILLYSTTMTKNNDH